MKQLLNNLVRLQEIELGSKANAEARTNRAELRATIPEQILEHYDRLMARGKKGIVPVRNQNCAGCHMRVPLAVVMTLRHADDIQLCENCGRYLHLPSEEASPEPKAAAKRKKSAAKRTSRRPS